MTTSPRWLSSRERSERRAPALALGASVETSKMQGNIPFQVAVGFDTWLRRHYLTSGYGSK